MLAPTQPGLLDLIRWLGTKDPDERYVYDNPHHCLAKQYFDSIGQEYRFSSLLGLPAPETEQDKIEWVAWKTPWTYGAALKRARVMYDQA